MKSGLIKAIAISGFVVLGIWGAHARSQGLVKLQPPTGLTATANGHNKKLTITTTSLPAGKVGVPYSFQLSATGGTPPYHWSIVSGSLPAGLTLADGKVSGKPLIAGDYGFMKVEP